MTKGFGMGNMGDILKQAQKVQRDMARVQEDLKERFVEGTAGGGMVTAVVNGRQDLVSVKLNPQVVDPDDVEMLQDLIVAAVAQGMKKSQDLASKEMGRITGGLGLPGGMPGFPGM